MNVIQMAFFAVCGVILALVLKKQSPEYGVLLSIAVCICIFFSILGKLSILVGAVSRLQELADMDAGYFRIVLKMIGITYVAEFAVNLCKDAGYSTIASQITMFSKISILLLSLPVIEAFLDMIMTVVV